MGPQFLKRMTLRSEASEVQKLVESGHLQRHRVTVRNLVEPLNYATVGFTLRRLPESVCHVLTSVLSQPHVSSYRTELRQQLNVIVTDFAHRELLYPEGITAIAVDAVYRDTSKEAFGAIGMAHVDFVSDWRSTLAAFHHPWREKVGSRYNRAKVVHMMNLWMPLDDVVHGSHLVLAPNGSVLLHPYTAVRQNGGLFQAQVVQPLETTRWFAKIGMSRGDVLVFDSTRTPHSAITFDKEPPATRHSIEVRFLLVCDS
jgi:hypothetical protein